MSNVYKLKLSDLNANLLQELHAQYDHAEVEVQVSICHFAWKSLI